MKDAVEFNRLLLNCYCYVTLEKSCKGNAKFTFLGIIWKRKGPGELIFGLSEKLKSKSPRIKIQILISL